MKALVYRGERLVAVEEVPDARVEQSTDVLVRVTTTNICGSDLHMYEGRTDGQVFGVGGAVMRVWTKVVPHP